MVEPDGPTYDIIIRLMRFGCWITKATNTHLECVTPIAFPLRQLLYESSSVSGYTYIVRLVLM